MVAYNLAHLTQPEHQWVLGPIQDDEALFLFALIRCMRIQRVLEVGGLAAYSSVNFLQAVGVKGVVYTVDFNPVPKIQDNHVVIQKNCEHVSASDVDDAAIDLIFYDCHAFDSQMIMQRNLEACGVITDRTVLALHDTNLHPNFTPLLPQSKELRGGWMHQDAERLMVNVLRNEGYEALMLHTTPEQHDESLPARHGLTILTKNRHLPT